MTVPKPMLYALVLAAVALGGFAYLVVKPKYDEQAATKAEITNVRTQLDAARSDVAAGEQARAARAADQATVVQLGRAVPDDLDQPGLVYQLNASAHKAGIELVAVTPTAAGDADTADAAKTDAPAADAAAGTAADATATAANSQPLQLELRGDYFALVSYLRRLRSDVREVDGKLQVRGRLVVVDTVALEPAESGFPAIKATVTARTFVTPPSTDPTTTGAAG